MSQTKLIVTIFFGLFFWWAVINYYKVESDTKAVELPKTRHSQFESNDEHHKMKVFKHKTWYGDTMLVTVDTTYFFYNKKQ